MRGEVVYIKPVTNCVGWMKRFLRKFDPVIGFFKKPTVELVGSFLIAVVLLVFWLLFGQDILVLLFRVHP